MLHGVGRKARIGSAGDRLADRRSAVARRLDVSSSRNSLGGSDGRFALAGSTGDASAKTQPEVKVVIVIILGWCLRWSGEYCLKPLLKL